MLVPFLCLGWAAGLGLLGEWSRPVGGIGVAVACVVLLSALPAMWLPENRREDWRAAWYVQHRLTALQPSSYQERRNLAHIALRAGHPGHAIELLECCLKHCSEAESPALEEELDRARRQLALCN